MKSFLNFIWIELCSPFVVMTKIYRVRIISVVMLLMYNFFSSSHTFLHHSKNRNIVLKTSFFLHLSSYTFSHACRHVSRIMSVWNGQLTTYVQNIVLKLSKPYLQPNQTSKGKFSFVLDPFLAKTPKLYDLEKLMS